MDVQLEQKNNDATKEKQRQPDKIFTLKIINVYTIFPFIFFTLTGIFFDILVICCVAREKTKQNINLKKLKKEKM